VIRRTQRPLPGNKQHSKETHNHAPGGIRTRNPSKQVAADPRVRPRGHWDRQQHLILNIPISLYLLQKYSCLYGDRRPNTVKTFIPSFFHIKSHMSQQNIMNEEKKVS
jgi:hypothetical protein